MHLLQDRYKKKIQTENCRWSAACWRKRKVKLFGHICQCCVCIERVKIFILKNAILSQKHGRSIMLCNYLLEKGNWYTGNRWQQEKAGLTRNAEATRRSPAERPSMKWSLTYTTRQRFAHTFFFSVYLFYF